MTKFYIYSKYPLLFKKSVANMWYSKRPLLLQKQWLLPQKTPWNDQILYLFKTPQPCYFKKSGTKYCIYLFKTPSSYFKKAITTKKEPKKWPKYVSLQSTPFLLFKKTEIRIYSKRPSPTSKKVVATNKVRIFVVLPFTIFYFLFCKLVDRGVFESSTIG